MSGCVSLTPALSRWERGNRSAHCFPWRVMLRRGPVFVGRDEARPSTARINHLLEGHAPSWPTNPNPGDIEKSSRAVYGSLSLRERERVRVRATKILAVFECVGVSPSPRPSPAGRGSLVRLLPMEGHALWRAMLRHGPVFVGRHGGRPSTAHGISGTRRSASLLSENSLHAVRELPDCSGA